MEGGGVEVGRQGSCPGRSLWSYSRRQMMVYWRKEESLKEYGERSVWNLSGGRTDRMRWPAGICEVCRRLRDRR